MTRVLRVWSGMPTVMGVVVIGQMGRDLVLRTAKWPAEGGSEPVLERLERLGGKGANQAVGLAQLGVPVSLVGVAGCDQDGQALCAQAAADGVDVTHVARRGRTALLVTLLGGPPHRRLFEDIPESALLTVDDIDRAGAALDDCDTLSIQLQQPVEVVLAAARRARRAGALVVADGAVAADAVADLLSAVDVLRADAHEAELLAGEPVPSVGAARALASRLLAGGPALVALAVPGVGDLIAWADGHCLFPYPDVPVRDRTGAGDAFMAGLIAVLRRGGSAVAAGDMATRAAGATVTRVGGRPDLSDLRQ
ncbi:PfkB family carbohydrate kinase [Mycobacterium sp. ITM-2016-00317]|uniref:PfkB family carbohydrate kinase n=1 Tax=Mycobacterium sp. ITM-2016-00317 TaxID=2099694 RepID=UPI00287F66DB|nr:PfkB family carbohydrate kinase [Mycobacterium sp. ITM-2016-00317]WNG87779.1 PfkB family carbohydrate kinase [Mycobacterium sp. ITM-2016-00317]